MNPKEKAKELVEKMFQTGSALYADRIGAKECALIAVDEILSLIHKDMNYQNVYVYFIEVKQEIKKL